MSFDGHAFFITFATALDSMDLTTLETMFHPDFVAEIPQSGERSRGFEQFRAQLEGYPSGGPNTQLLPEARFLDDEQRWAITPAFTVVALADAGEFTLIWKSTYPDGTVWHLVALIEIRDDKLYRMENYFAPEMPAPLLGALVGANAQAQ